MHFVLYTRLGPAPASPEQAAEIMGEVYGQ
jgi:hypothetical protein